MKGIVILLLGLMECHQKAPEQAQALMYTTDATKEYVGTVTFKDTEAGLQVGVQLWHIPTGEHGFHIHVYPDCGAQVDAFGEKQPALKAGGHYDPNETHKHLGPNNNGHLGDLPVIQANALGDVDMCVYAPRLTVADVVGRSVIVHAGGDNYQDTPFPLGGGGKRIVCGVIE